jgi:hypothetical protein
MRAPPASGSTSRNRSRDRAHFSSPVAQYSYTVVYSPRQCPRSRAFTGRSFGRCGGLLSESAGLTFNTAHQVLAFLDCEQVPPRQCPRSRALTGRSFGRRGLLLSRHQASWARYPHPLHTTHRHISCCRSRASPRHKRRRQPTKTISKRVGVKPSFRSKSTRISSVRHLPSPFQAYHASISATQDTAPSISLASALTNERRARERDGRNWKVGFCRTSRTMAHTNSLESPTRTTPPVPTPLVGRRFGSRAAYLWSLRRSWRSTSANARRYV